MILANHLCCFTSDAPLLLPMRVVSRLSSSRFTMSLHDLSAAHAHRQHIDTVSTSSGRQAGGETYDEIFGVSRKCTGMFMMLLNVSLRSAPLNGVVAN